MTNAKSTFQHGMSLERAYGVARAEQSHRITQSIKYEKTSELIWSNLLRNTMSTRPWNYMPPCKSNTSGDGVSITTLGSPFGYVIDLSVKKLFLIPNLNEPVWFGARLGPALPQGQELRAAPPRAAAEAAALRTPGSRKRKGRGKGKGTGEEGGGGGAVPLRSAPTAPRRRWAGKPDFGGKVVLWRARESRAAEPSAQPGPSAGPQSLSPTMPADGELLSAAAAHPEPGEQQYLQQVRHILQHGHRREDRTGTGTISVFGMQARYSLRGGHRRDPRLPPPAPAPARRGSSSTPLSRSERGGLSHGGCPVPSHPRDVSVGVRHPLATPYLISQPHNVRWWHCPLCGEKPKSVHPDKWLVPADILELFFQISFHCSQRRGCSGRECWRSCCGSSRFVRYLGVSAGGGPESGINRMNWWAVD